MSFGFNKVRNGGTESKLNVNWTYRDSQCSHPSSAEKEKRRSRKRRSARITSREPEERKPEPSRVLRRHQRRLLDLCVFRGQHRFG